MGTTVTIDTETLDVKLLWEYIIQERQNEYFRLGTFSFGESEKVYSTTSFDEMREIILEADVIAGSNLHNFDLLYLLSDEEHVGMAKQGRIIDSWTLSTLYNPPPRYYINRFGQPRVVKKPEDVLSWNNLDEQAYQLEVPGKAGDLKAIAKKHGGYDKIPIDDVEWNRYAKQDVRASRAVCRGIMSSMYESDFPYWDREELIASLCSLIRRNGWTVDYSACEARVREIDSHRKKYVNWLSKKYGLPTLDKKGEPQKAPQSTKLGKEAIVRAFQDLGVKDSEFPRTEKTGNISFSREELLDMANAHGGDVLELAETVTALAGMRPLAQQLLDHVYSDGKVHPNITMLQRSGRWSTTEPGLTTWGERGAGRIDKKLLIADSGGLQCGIDKSQCDARFVAGMSGDEKYAERFEPGKDSYMDAAIMVIDAERLYATEEATATFRQNMKNKSHGWGYGGGAETLAGQHPTSRDKKQSLADAEKFCAYMNRTYRKVWRWRRQVAEIAKRRGWVMGEWGRRMIVQSGREYTQAPALKGQNATREMMCDHLIEFPFEIQRCVVGQVHDEFVFTFPKEYAEEYRQIATDIMTCDWKPKEGGMKMDFPAKAGPLANNWFEAGH